MKKTTHLIPLLVLYIFVSTSITCESKRDSLEAQVDNIFAQWTNRTLRDVRSQS